MDSLAVKNIYWKKEWKIPGTEWIIRGYSRSAYRTGFYIPQLDIMLDAGPQNFNKPSHIFITHTHIDHVACLPLTMIGDIHGDHVFEIYGPGEAEKYIHDYISSMFSLNAVEQVLECRNWYNYHSQYSKEFFPIKCNGKSIQVNIFQCDHRIPTIGYGFTEIRKKLKSEYLSLSGKEIVELKNKGIVVTEIIHMKKFAYICDTSINVFQLNENILKYPVIFIECTFFLPDEIENSISTKHIHWSQLKGIIMENPDIMFVLFHFSQRYSDEEINRFFGKEKEDNKIANIYCWT